MKKIASLLLLLLIASCTQDKDITKSTIVPQEDWVRELKTPLRAENSVVLLLPMSGANAELGKNVLNACILAAKNSKIAYHIIDTADCPDDLNRTSFKNVKAVIGPIFFNEIYKYSAIFNETPIFSLSNNPNANNEHICACGLSPKEEIAAIFAHMKQNNIRAVTIAAPRGKFFDEIVEIIQKEAQLANISEEYFNLIRYDSPRNLNTIAGGHRAIFIFEPLIDTEKFPQTSFFTLSSIALSDPQKWENVRFAYADNKNQREFITEYQHRFKDMPTVMSLIAHDLITALDHSIANKKSIYDAEFDGTLGQFNIKKEKGLSRKLEILQIVNGEKQGAALHM